MMEMDEITYNHSDLPFQCFRRFQDMKNKREFCDITIKFGDSFIMAHRVVLAAAMPYFRDLLSGCQETRGEQREISVEEIDPLSLESLVDFAYNCTIRITADNVMNLLSAASILKVEEVRDACCRFLTELLSLENALSVRQTAEKFHCAQLLESAISYICRNFDALSKTAEFLNSSCECVEQLIGRRDLQCSNEENVVEFVIKWVEVSPEERKNNVAQLLRKIRMISLTPEFLTNISKHELIRHSAECRDIVEDARTYHFLPHHRVNISSFEKLPRSSTKRNGKLGGTLIPGIYTVSRSTVLTVQRFEPETEKWNSQMKTSFQSDFHNGTLAAGDGKLYYNDNNNLKSCGSVYGKWITNGDFGNNVYNSGAAVLDNKLYLCGGQEGEMITNRVKCCDLEKNELNTVMPMSVARSYPGVVALGEHLYVLGGENCNHEYVPSVERYDPRTDHWTPVSPMLMGRCGMGCTTLAGKIYVCAGSSSDVLGEDDFVLTSAEVFDPLKNSWSYISSMKTGRFLCSLAAYCGKLYALGGYNKNEEPVNSVEMYDPETDEWRSSIAFEESMKFVQAVAVSSSDI